MNLRSRILMCLLSFLTSQAHSQESGDLDAGAVAEAESQFLFINMLEFLAEFETDDGEWISPEVLGNEEFTVLDEDFDNKRVSAETENSQGPRQRVITVSGEDERTQ